MSVAVARQALKLHLFSFSPQTLFPARYHGVRVRTMSEARGRLDVELPDIEPAQLRCIAYEYLNAEETLAADFI